MSEPRNIKWSKSEKTIARTAFNQAIDKEHAMLASRIQSMAKELNDADDIWKLHDFHCTGQKIRIADIVDKYDVLAP